MRINKELIRKSGFICTTAILLTSAVICTGLRISGVTPSVPLTILAAEGTLPAAAQSYNKISEESIISKPDEISIPAVTDNIPDPEKKTIPVSEKNTDKPYTFEASEPTEEELKQYNAEHSGEEQYPVTEISITKGNESFGNIEIKNSSSYDLDIAEELKGKLGFTMENTNEPQVLIYHTHTGESFLTYDTGYFFESFYPRTDDKTKNVCAVGEEISKQLNSAGIVTIHDTTIHDSTYSGAYDRSMATIQKYLKKYPTIKVVLDIHRDGIGTDTERCKPVCTVNNKKAAQIMLLAGYNYDGCEEFKDWEYNLRFALKIQKQAQEMYPGMMRPLYFADFMYNMNANTGSLLIEIGADSNTVEEVRYSGYLLGEVLKNVLSPPKT